MTQERTLAQLFEKDRKMRAGEMACNFCNVPLTIPVCPRCGKPEQGTKVE